MVAWMAIYDYLDPDHNDMCSTIDDHAGYLIIIIN